MNATIKGTVKIGRWVYPAEQDEQHTIRNTKRDGSGEWVKADSAPFTPNEAPAPKASHDHNVARAIFTNIFEAFSVHGSDALRPGKVDGRTVTERRAIEIAGYLVKVGLVVRDKDSEGKPMWQAAETYDSRPIEDAMAEFEAKVPADVEIRQMKISVTPIAPKSLAGAAAKKPGKSTWQIGTPCPQGHTLTAETLYVMPSGRKQCRACRKGYASNS